MKQTRSDSLREALGEQILSGVLAPGTRPDESGLAERFKVSRTPVREALKQLAAIGLADSFAEHGAVVEATLRGNSDEACQSMRKHVSVVRRAVGDYAAGVAAATAASGARSRRDSA